MAEFFKICSVCREENTREACQRCKKPTCSKCRVGFGQSLCKDCDEDFGFDEMDVAWDFYGGLQEGE